MAKLLKEQREKLNKELNEIARITRIKASYLKAIEEEDFAKLPVEVYTRGYIREYARFLGVSPDVAIAPYETYLERIKGGKDKEMEKNVTFVKFPESSAQTEAIEPPSLSAVSQGSDRRIVKNIPNIFSQKIAWWVISLILIVVVVYFLMPKGKENLPIQHKIEPGVQYKTPEIAQSMPSQDASQGKGIQLKASPEPVIPPAVQEEAGDKTKPAQGDRKKHNLDITATDKTWIRVVIDGTDKKELLLNAGERVSYEANQSINVLIGNAAGVSLKFNGKEFRNLGDKGQVVTLNFPVTIPTPPTPQPSNSSNF